MLIDGDQIRLGYPGDGGLGARLAREVVEGRKTATCLPSAEMTQAQVDDVLASVGRECDVVDPDGRVWCRVVVTGAYLATFREPTDALLRGEGYGEDVARFQADHVAPAAPWIVAGIDLSDDAAGPLALLPPEYRLVVTLHDGLLWTVPEIAAATGQAAQVIRQRLRRGRMRLAGTGRSANPAWGERHTAALEALHSASSAGTPRPGTWPGGGLEAGPTRPPDSLEEELLTSAASGAPAVLQGGICVLLFSPLPAVRTGT